jgi:hypothetical protein
VNAITNVEYTTGASAELLSALSVARHTAYSVTFDGTGNLVLETATVRVNGDKIVFYGTAGTLPTGLFSDRIYYVVNATTDNFQVAWTMGGAPVDFIGNGTPPNTYKVIDIVGATGRVTIDGAGVAVDLNPLTLAEVDTGDIVIPILSRIAGANIILNRIYMRASKS